MGAGIRISLDEEGREATWVSLHPVKSHWGIGYAYKDVLDALASAVVHFAANIVDEKAAVENHLRP